MLVGASLLLGGGYAIYRGQTDLETRRLAQLPVPELEKLALRYPNDAEVLFRYATALQQSDGHNDAVGVFARVVQLDSRHLPAYLGLARSQGAIGNLAEAETAYKKVQELDPRNHEARSALANLYYVNGETASAAREMEAALKVRPKDAGGWFTLGHLYGDLLQVDRSAEAFQHVTRLAPQRPDGWRALGRVHWHQGRLAEAESTLKRALALRPGDARTLLWLAQIYLRLPETLENRRRAEETLRAAASAGPRPLPEAQLELGRFLVRQDRLAHAESYLREALRHQPDLEPAQEELGRLLVRTGRKAEGEALLQRARQAATKRRRLQALEAAVRKTPKDAKVLLELARLYREHHNHPAAMRAYRLYLTERPEDEKTVEEMVAFRKEVLPQPPPARTPPPGPGEELFGEGGHNHDHAHEHGPGESHDH